MRHWYQQFWPWFLILLPLSAVIASLTTALIAHQHADNVLSDNFSRRGKAVYADTHLQEQAVAKGIYAKVEYRKGGLHVTLSLPPAQQDQALRFALIHPTLARKDIVLTLRPIKANHYFMPLTHNLNGAWQLQISPLNAHWQIKHNIERNDTLRRTPHAN